MDNKELEDILQNRFGILRAPRQAPSLVPDVMRRVTATAPVSLSTRRRFEWLLILGWLLGAVVFFTSWQGFDVTSLMDGVSFASFGSYETAAAQVAAVLVALGLGSPVLYLALHD